MNVSPQGAAAKVAPPREQAVQAERVVQAGQAERAEQAQRVVQEVQVVAVLAQEMLMQLLELQI